jgi:hypothetical protein
MFDTEHHAKEILRKLDEVLAQQEILRSDQLQLRAIVMFTSADLTTNIANVTTDVATLIAQGSTGAPQLITQAQLDAANANLVTLDATVKAAIGSPATGTGTTTPPSLTTLTGSPTPQTVVVSNQSGISVGDSITIDNVSAAQETVTVTAEPTPTTITAVFLNNHTFPINCLTAGGTSFTITATA